MDLELLVWITIVAVGMSFVATGSTIGYPLRLIAFHTLGRAQAGPLRLDSLLRCPYCNAWWGAGILSYLIACPWWVCLAHAFAACGIAAIVQAQWGLAAHDDFETEEK
jgi:hypothetical protein